MIATREPVQRHPNEILRRKLPDHLSKRMFSVYFAVAIGEDQDSVRASDPSSEELDEVERRFVSPLRVLEHENARSLA